MRVLPSSVDGTGLPNQSDKVHIVGSNPTTRSKINGDACTKAGEKPLQGF